MPFTVFRGIFSFFPLREFCKDRNQWTSQVQYLVNIADESQLPIWAVTAFVQSLKSVSLVESWWKIIHFLLTYSGCFLLTAPFSWSNWEQYVLALLIGNSMCWYCWAFWKKLTTGDFVPIPPSLSLDEDWPLLWLVVVHLACPTISSVPHYCIVSTFHCLS